MIGLTTKPNCHLAWRWVRESWARGQTLLLWPDCERLITTEWPRWLQTSKCPTNNSPLTLNPIFPRILQILCFGISLPKQKKTDQFSIKSMRMMLMTISSILMTLQINWRLIEVPLSVRSFFLSGQVLQRSLPKRSQQPVKASPLHSHTKRAFSPGILNQCACRISFFFLSGRKPFQGFVESSWTVGASLERMRGLLYV